MRKQPILLVFLFLWTVSGMRAQEEQDMVAPTVEEAAEETYIQVETTGRIAVGDTTDLSAVWPKTMQARLDALMSAPLLETSQLGLMVWDLQDDSCLYARGARWLMRPASTMKVIHGRNGPRPPGRRLPLQDLAAADGHRLGAHAQGQPVLYGRIRPAFLGR